MQTKFLNSKNGFLIAFTIILATHFLYFPKWTKERTEATISWDVSGYYMYLPAAFIYNDIKECKFKGKILKKYYPTPTFQQAFVHEKSGNYVMKYSLGQAIVFSPFFAGAHLWAYFDADYPADGFSKPYQFGISMCSLFFTLIGLFFLRKSLLNYFSETATSLTLLGIVLGSNYLNYSAIDGAMTHNTLFSIYSLLIYITIKFYKSPSYKKSIGIGLLVGLAALIRPTEIISCIIPLIWGVRITTRSDVKNRFKLIKKEWKKILLAIITCFSIGSLQLLYWKYASGEWIVYSYEDQGFSWLKPHLHNGFFSYKSGWLTYSPFMAFTLLGFIILWKSRKLDIFFASFIFASIFIYITFSWDIWWYGGSLGQRAMVQAYPVLAIPLCSLFQKLDKSSIYIKLPTYAFMLVLIYANIWFTHQAHKGKILHPGQMTKAYFWSTLFDNVKDNRKLKLLDNVNELYEGKRVDIRTLFREDSTKTVLNKETQNSSPITIPISQATNDYDWIRVSANFKIKFKEWDYWLMTQFIVEQLSNDITKHANMIRVQRHMHDNQSKTLYIDIRKPEKSITDLAIKFWNASGQKSIDITHIKVETYKEI